MSRSSLFRSPSHASPLTVLLWALFFGITGELTGQQTREEKIQNALSAAPDFVAREAAVWDWPTQGAEAAVLRAGTNGWTCLPSPPNSPGNSPRCFDEVFLPVALAINAGRQAPAVDGVGLSYMLQGASAELGPHIMIVVPVATPLGPGIGQSDGSGRPFRNNVPTVNWIIMPVAGGGSMIQVLPNH